MRLSARQREILDIIGEDGADGWGEVWTQYSGNWGDHAALKFHNFDRVVASLKRYGLVEVAEGTSYITRTSNTAEVSRDTSGHRQGNIPEYRVWQGIKTRTTNRRDKSYARYGGRGITICARWLHSFENFIADMGPRPSPDHQIERIDNDHPYEPGNCRWATRSEQRVAGSNPVAPTT